MERTLKYHLGQKGWLHVGTLCTAGWSINQCNSFLSWKVENITTSRNKKRERSEGQVCCAVRNNGLTVDAGLQALTNTWSESDYWSRHIFFSLGWSMQRVSSLTTTLVINPNCAGRHWTSHLVHLLCVAGIPGGNGRGQILQPEAWRRQNPSHQAEQEGWVHTHTESLQGCVYAFICILAVNEVVTVVWSSRMRRSVCQSECFICILLVNQTVTEKKHI